MPDDTKRISKQGGVTGRSDRTVRTLVGSVTTPARPAPKRPTCPAASGRPQGALSVTAGPPRRSPSHGLPARKRGRVFGTPAADKCFVPTNACRNATAPASTVSARNHSLIPFSRKIPKCPWYCRGTARRSRRRPRPAGATGRHPRADATPDRWPGVRPRTGRRLSWFARPAGGGCKYPAFHLSGTRGPVRSRVHFHRATRTLIGRGSPIGR